MAERTRRCDWAKGDPALVAYHDDEWGVPVHDDSTLFELLTLEGAQAGLSWITILKKRDGYRRAFADFDPAKVAAYDARKRHALLRDHGIVRNFAKIDSTVGNAKAVLDVQTEFGGFAEFLWSSLPEGRPLRTARGSVAEIPSETAESKRLSKVLKSRGFKFVGPTTVYAFMQAIGMVNDHVTDCFRYRELDL